MFHSTISSGSLPLIGEDADLYFDKITGTSVNNDWSFLATLRAFLGKRIGDKSMAFFPMALRNTGEFSAEELKLGCDCLRLIYFRNVRGEIDEAVATIREAIDHIDGFTSVTKVTQFFSGAFPVYAWSCEERNAAVILTGTVDTRKLHVLQACIPTVLPWYFPNVEDGKKYTDDEYALCNSLNKSTPDEYKAVIRRIAAQYDIREVVVRKKLTGITKRFHEIELKNAERSIEDYEYRICEAYAQIDDLLRDRENTMTRVYGLKARLSEGGAGNDLVDYFLYNRGVDLKSVDGTSVEFTAFGYLENWDDDRAECIIDNLDSYPYDEAANYGFDREDIQRLFNAVFMDRSIRIRIYADYQIDLGGSVNTRQFESHNVDLITYLPNPHIYHYDCLGDYKRRILECLHGGSVVQAFEYCVASSRSLNWSDSTVLTRFMRDICDDMDDLACFELPDGTNVDIHQAITWCKS